VNIKSSYILVDANDVPKVLDQNPEISSICNYYLEKAVFKNNTKEAMYWNIYYQGSYEIHADICLLILHCGSYSFCTLNTVRVTIITIITLQFYPMHHDSTQSCQFQDRTFNG